MKIKPKKEIIKMYNTLRKAKEFCWAEAAENKGVNIYELIECSHVPAFNRILALKLEEIKSGVLKADIEAYKNKVNQYKMVLLEYEWGRRKRGDENEYPQLYWFELSKFADRNWSITKFDPWPPSIEPYYKSIPLDIVYLLFIPIMPVGLDRLVVLEDILYDRRDSKIDLRYIWCSCNHIVGTVRENNQEWEQGLENGIIPGDAGVEFLYSTLERMLYRYPGIEKEFIRDYAVEMLPKFKKLSEGNSLDL